MKRLQFLLLYIVFSLFIIQISTSCQGQNFETKIAPVLEKYLDAWNGGNLEQLDAITSPDFELRMTPDFEPKIGRDELKEEISNTRRAFPDFNIEVDKKLFVGDSAVVIHWNLTGTNTGTSSMPATGNNVNIPGFSVIFFNENLLTGEWLAFSDLMWVSQLGFTVKPPDFPEK